LLGENYGTKKTSHRVQLVEIDHLSALDSNKLFTVMMRNEFDGITLQQTVTSIETRIIFKRHILPNKWIKTQVDVIDF